MNLLLKTYVGRNRRPNVATLECSNCRREGEKGGRVVRWQSGKDGRVKRWVGGRFLVLLKDGGHMVSSSFHLYVSDFKEGNEETGWVQDPLTWPQGWKDSP